MDKNLETEIRKAAEIGTRAGVATSLFPDEINALLSEIDALRRQAEFDALRAENAKLRESLSIYASEENWIYYDGWYWASDRRPRQIALDALKED